MPYGIFGERVREIDKLLTWYTFNQQELKLLEEEIKLLPKPVPPKGKGKT